jgi:hypothetical protein
MRKNILFVAILILSVVAVIAAVQLAKDSVKPSTVYAYQDTATPTPTATHTPTVIPDIYFYSQRDVEAAFGTSGWPGCSAAYYAAAPTIDPGETWSRTTDGVGSDIPGIGGGAEGFYCTDSFHWCNFYPEPCNIGVTVQGESSGWSEALVINVWPVNHILYGFTSDYFFTGDGHPEIVTEAGNYCSYINPRELGVITTNGYQTDDSMAIAPEPAGAGAGYAYMASCNSFFGTCDAWGSHSISYEDGGGCTPANTPTPLPTCEFPCVTATPTSTTPTPTSECSWDFYESNDSKAFTNWDGLEYDNYSPDKAWSYISVNTWVSALWFITLDTNPVTGYNDVEVFTHKQDTTCYPNATFHIVEFQLYVLQLPSGGEVADQVSVLSFAYNDGGSPTDWPKASSMWINGDGEVWMGGFSENNPSSEAIEEDTWYNVRVEILFDEDCDENHWSRIIVDGMEWWQDEDDTNACPATLPDTVLSGMPQIDGSSDYEEVYIDNFYWWVASGAGGAEGSSGDAPQTPVPGVTVCPLDDPCSPSTATATATATTVLTPPTPTPTPTDPPPDDTATPVCPNRYCFTSAEGTPTQEPRLVVEFICDGCTVTPSPTPTVTPTPTDGPSPTPTFTATPIGCMWINEICWRSDLNVDLSYDYNQDGIVDYRDDFVEIANCGETAVDIYDWRLLYDSARTDYFDDIVRPGALKVFYNRDFLWEIEDTIDDHLISYGVGRLVNQDGGIVDYAPVSDSSDGSCMIRIDETTWDYKRRGTPAQDNDYWDNNATPTIFPTPTVTPTP